MSFLTYELYELHNYVGCEMSVDHVHQSEIWDRICLGRRISVLLVLIDHITFSIQCIYYKIKRGTNIGFGFYGTAKLYLFSCLFRLFVSCFCYDSNNFDGVQLLIQNWTTKTTTTTTNYKNNTTTIFTMSQRSKIYLSNSGQWKDTIKTRFIENLYHDIYIQLEERP